MTLTIWLKIDHQTQIQSTRNSVQNVKFPILVVLELLQKQLHIQSLTFKLKFNDIDDLGHNLESNLFCQSEAHNYMTFCMLAITQVCHVCNHFCYMRCQNVPDLDLDLYNRSGPNVIMSIEIDYTTSNLMVIVIFCELIHNSSSPRYSPSKFASL